MSINFVCTQYRSRNGSHPIDEALNGLVVPHPRETLICRTSPPGEIPLAVHRVFLITLHYPFRSCALGCLGVQHKCFSLPNEYGRCRACRRRPTGNFGQRI